MLLRTLGDSLLGNMLAGKAINRARAAITRANYGSQFKKRMIPPRPLTNFETQKYYHNEPRFNGIILEITCLKK